MYPLQFALGIGSKVSAVSFHHALWTVREAARQVFLLLHVKPGLHCNSLHELKVFLSFIRVLPCQVTAIAVRFAMKAKSPKDACMSVIQ